VLLRVLGRLFAELAQRLAAQERGATQLIVELARARGAPIACEVRLFRPSAQAARWLELAELELERLRLRAAVTAIQVRVAALGPLELRQRELFESDERSAESARLVRALIERLTSRLGHQAVSRVLLTPDPLPERSYRATAALEGRKPPLRGVKKTPPAPLARPLALVAPARHSLPVEVAADGSPAAFRWRGRWQRVMQAWGPERIESGWWRGRSTRRDYYRVETEQGSQAWLFRRLEDDRWFLHGWFV